MNKYPPPSPPLDVNGKWPATTASTPEKTIFQIGGDNNNQKTKPGTVWTSPIVVDSLQSTHATAAASKPQKARKRNPWTPQEDQQLETFMRSNSDHPTKLAEFAKGLNRTTKQCRERWENYLRDGIQKGKWQPEEEDIIRDLYQTFGSRYVGSDDEFSFIHTCSHSWTAMAKVLKTRSANDIKNKWHAMRNKERRRSRHRSQAATAIEDSKHAARSEAPSLGNAEDKYGLNL